MDSSASDAWGDGIHRGKGGAMLKLLADAWHAAPLPCRNDAGLAAAELALAVESAVLDTQSIDTVGTTGHVRLEPNAINSVPRKAHVEIGEHLSLLTGHRTSNTMLYRNSALH